MALQSSGAIKLSEIQSEFGGSNPISLSEYYRNGSYTTSNNTGVPTSGQISVSDFYGGTNITSPTTGTSYITNGAITSAGTALGLSWTVNNAGHWAYGVTGVVATLTLPNNFSGSFVISATITHYNSSGNAAIESGEDKAAAISINSSTYPGSSGTYYQGWGATPASVTYSKTVTGLTSNDVVRIWNGGDRDWRNFNALGEYWSNISVVGA